MPFAIKTVFRGMRARPAVARRIEEWAEKLDTAFAGIQRCDVVVEVPHRHQRQGRHFHVRVTLAVPGETIAVNRDPDADGAHEDVLVAVRDAFHAARRRLEDYVRRDLRREAPVV